VNPIGDGGNKQNTVRLVRASNKMTSNKTIEEKQEKVMKTESPLYA
jgi:hypothetical protein